jgi:ActR/RegA family two-component response regulator
MAHEFRVLKPETGFMPRILLVGSGAPLLRVLANIFSARGGEVRVSTDVEHTRDALTEFEPHVVLWDSEPGDASLDPTVLGFSGRTLVLAHHLNAERDRVPLRKVLLKPVSTDDVIAALLEGPW